MNFLCARKHLRGKPEGLGSSHLLHLRVQGSRVPVFYLSSLNPSHPFASCACCPQPLTDSSSTVVNTHAFSPAPSSSMRDIPFEPSFQQLWMWLEHTNGWRREHEASGYEIFHGPQGTDGKPLLFSTKAEVQWVCAYACQMTLGQIRMYFEISVASCSCRALILSKGDAILKRANSYTPHYVVVPGACFCCLRANDGNAAGLAKYDMPPRADSSPFLVAEAPEVQLN